MAELSDDIEDIEAWASMESLYDKAIQSPSEITQDEKHAILEWPSLEQMEETSQKYVGKSLQDLFHTAANDPLALTYPECRLFKDDFHILRSLDSVKYSTDRMHRRIARQDLSDKWQQARAAVSAPDELKARENALEVYLEKLKAHSKPLIEAGERYWTHPPDWVQKILDREGKGWGYVIYRPSIIHEEESTKEAWRACWDYFNELLSFHPVTMPFLEFGEKIQDSKIIDFVDYEPEMGGVDQLRQDFRDRRDKYGLQPGVLSNVFINVPTECRDTHLGPFPYNWAWAIDPDWSLPGPDADGYDGRVKVTCAQLFNKFYELMSTKKVTLKKIWEEFHEVNETLPDGPMPCWIMSPKEKWPNN
ncbi:hypothetical protein Asppvi_005241 [Aspergillus pseudoviridinutans]|uniref:Uncharacterized protein n=1 Tax=Aspergillus pseudoviridinutans TaxID=1517512 RepID=A0A9P3BBX6_9EURO|nr:uncharacterized protein Asppvi_005241 [Aspergillus pseudoviridinutans]GIJ86353.1 hypothetical protein Asppvi_005241 [Aspergillus pseudoviridinutans]